MMSSQHLQMSNRYLASNMRIFLPQMNLSSYRKRERFFLRLLVNCKVEKAATARNKLILTPVKKRSNVKSTFWVN